MEMNKVANNPQAEKAILAAILIAPEVYDQVHERLSVNHFYTKANRIIYETFVELKSRDIEIDLLILSGELKKKGKLVEIGGEEYLVELAEDASVAINVDHYIKIVNENYVLRELYTFSSNIATQCVSGGDASQLLIEAEQEVFKLSKRYSHGGFINWHQLLEEMDANLKELIATGGKDITGLATGFSSLDHITHGLQGSDLIVLAARPSVGKTAFALNILANVASNSKNNNPHVAFFSLEMASKQLGFRMLATQSHVEILKYVKVI